MRLSAAGARVPGATPAARGGAHAAPAAVRRDRRVSLTGMTDASRRAYLGLGRAFVTIGGVVAVGSVLDRTFGWGFFSGSPLGTAGFLVLIGALLLWTVRQADAAPAPAEADPTHDVGDGEEAEEEAAAPGPADEPTGPDLERP